MKSGAYGGVCVACLFKCHARSVIKTPLPSLCVIPFIAQWEPVLSLEQALASMLSVDPLVTSKYNC